VDFVTNGWYLIAWDDEVGPGLLARWIADTPVVLYRTSDGRAVVLEDRCPHRQYPLSLGALDGDVLQCGYHGYRFDSGGICIGVAEQAQVPPASVRRFPTEERFGGVWIWPGAARLADPRLIPDLGWITAAGWRTFRGMVPVAARQSLLVENLLDLSHETFLHAGSIGSPIVASTHMDVDSSENYVSFRRQLNDAAPPPFYARSCGINGNVDRSQQGEFFAPGVFVLHVGVRATDAPDDAFRSKVFYGMTPASAGLTYDFYAATRDYLLDDAELTDFQHQSQLVVLREDVAALEAQEHRYRLGEARRESSMKSDKAALLGRRALRRMRDAERGTAVAAGAPELIGDRRGR
jgi:phenylpropionate dioxygenase-like ring-hydroxylating dioxygenase large terminal subunit